MIKLFILPEEQSIKIWETISLLLLISIDQLKLILNCPKAISEEVLVSFNLNSITRQSKIMRRVPKLNQLKAIKEMLAYQMG